LAEKNPSDPDFKVKVNSYPDFIVKEKLSNPDRIKEKYISKEDNPDLY
jgi:hypothetical protein